MAKVNRDQMARKNKEQVAPSVAVSDLRSILRAGQEKITTVKLALLTLQEFLLRAEIINLMGFRF